MLRRAGRQREDGIRRMCWRGAAASAGHEPQTTRRRSMPFQSRAVGSLVELHEREMRSFLEVWKRFVASDLPMPEAQGDQSYENRERLAGHVLMSARGYLTRIGEWVTRPVSDVDASKDPYEIVSRASQFAD